MIQFSALLLCLSAGLHRTMVWFIIGAALGVAHALVGLARGSMEIRHPARGMLVSALSGLLIYGTSLWVVFSLLLGM